MRQTQFQPGTAPLAAMTSRGLPAAVEAARVNAELRRRAVTGKRFYDIGPSGLGEPRATQPARAVRSVGRSDTARRVAVAGLAGRCRAAGAVAVRAAAPTPAPARSAVGDSAVATLRRTLPWLAAYRAELAAGNDTPTIRAGLATCRELAASCLRYSDQ